MFNSFTARACQARAHCRCVGRLARFPQAHKDKRDKTLRLTKAAAAAAAAAWAIRKFFRRGPRAEGRAPRHHGAAHSTARGPLLPPGPRGSHRRCFCAASTLHRLAQLEDVLGDAGRHEVHLVHELAWFGVGVGVGAGVGVGVGVRVGVRI